MYAFFTRARACAANYKGDIPTYGNFANFKHIAVLNHVNLAATGH